MGEHLQRTPLLSPRRVLILAGNTFTQLVRMKVFYFVLVFLLITIAIHFLNVLPHTTGPESVGAEELRQIKGPLIFVMKLFALVLAIVATALLIPRDLEDRTLYTILAKPVPRLDYLLGKLLGVIALVFVSLLIMSILLNVVLHLKTEAVLADHMAKANFLIQEGVWTEADREDERREVLRHGPTWSLQGALFIIFLETAVMAALALLISTFSSSTLFTVAIGGLSYFIGLVISDGREALLGDSVLADDPTAEIASRALVVLFPDFRTFRISDQIIAGEVLPASAFGTVLLIGSFYVALYIVLSWFVFSDKEI